MGQQPKYLTRAELAAHLRVSKSFVDKAMLYSPEKLPPYVRITDRVVRFPTDLLVKWEVAQLENTQCD
jgi:hypothetical protein